jgi:REP element-mobilizing transposase RayT
MAVKILVASPIVSFGELVRSTLSSHGDFQVKVCETGDQVLDAMTGDNFDVLILDAAIADQPFAPLVQKIIACVPEQKIAVIPPENKPDHPSLENVPAHGFLFRPFLDPDLINLVQRLAAAAEEGRKSLTGGRPGGLSENTNRIPWTSDPSAASVEMSRLLLGSSALAGLIIHEGELYVHAGRISPEASQEIRQMLSQVRNEKDKDLVRFTFLVADDCEALIYAVSLVSGWTLALVYDVSMPLTRVRSQATAFAARLREEIPLEDLIELPDAIEPSPKIDVNEPEVEESLEEESNPVDISDIMKEINSGEDLSGDEFLNLTSIDDELISLINDLNAPKEVKDAVEKPPGEEKSDAIDKLYSQPIQPTNILPAGEAAIDNPIEGENHSTGAAEEEMVSPESVSEIPESAEEQSPQVQLPSADEVSALNEAEMEATLSRLEDEMGVVVGEQIPQLEKPSIDKISLEDADDMEAAHSRLEDEMGVVVGEQIPQLEKPSIDKVSLEDADDMEAVSSQLENETEEPAEGQTPAEVEKVSEGAIASDEIPPEVIGIETVSLLEEVTAKEQIEITETPEPEELELMEAPLDEFPTSVGTDSEMDQIPLAEPEMHPAQNEVMDLPAETEEDLEKTLLSDSETIAEISPLPVTAVEEVGEIPAGKKEISSTGNQLYTLVFAPRRSDQFLTGELAGFLGDLLKNAGAAYPWKLTGVAIRPDYLRLSIEISPFLEASEIIAFIKEYTDDAINRKIPRTDVEINPEPFWAEEYLSIPDHSIPGGDQLHEFLQSIKTNPVSPV